MKLLLNKISLSSQKEEEIAHSQPVDWQRGKGEGGLGMRAITTRSSLVDIVNHLALHGHPVVHWGGTLSLQYATSPWPWDHRPFLAVAQMSFHSLLTSTNLLWGHSRTPPF